LLPLQPEAKRVAAKGRGAWKVWTPEAVLRVAFAEQSSASRQVAKEIDEAHSPDVPSRKEENDGVCSNRSHL
jgi:hypothetical protein